MELESLPPLIIPDVCLRNPVFVDLLVSYFSDWFGLRSFFSKPCCSMFGHSKEPRQRAARRCTDHIVLSYCRYARETGYSEKSCWEIDAASQRPMYSPLCITRIHHIRKRKHSGCFFVAFLGMANVVLLYLRPFASYVIAASDGAPCE